MVEESNKNIRVRLYVDTDSDHLGDILLAVNEITGSIVIVEEITYLPTPPPPDPTLMEDNF